MNIIGISVNHHTAPVELREALHLQADEIRQFLLDLKQDKFDESFIISTCNRTEIFGIPKTAEVSHEAIEEFLVKNKPVEGIKADHFEKFFSQSAVNHLFRVAAGIESQFVGDNQILGQVRESFTMAETQGTVGLLTKRLFDAAIRVGKRAKTETTISDGAITVSYAAVQLIEKIFSNLSKKSALVIGLGETGEIAARHLRDKNIGKLTLTNRTFEKAEKLAEELHSQIAPFATFKDNLQEFDIIISATSAPGLILTEDDLRAMMKKRGSSPTILMDIALPRDISPDARKYDSIFYHDIDSLNIIVEQNLRKRKEEIPKVEAIINEEIANFFSWLSSLEVAPTIKSLRDAFEDIRAEEVKAQINRFNEADREKLEIITKRIINKILHHPTTELRKIAGIGVDSPEGASKIAIIRELFGIEATGKEGMK